MPKNIYLKMLLAAIIAFGLIVYTPAALYLLGGVTHAMWNAFKHGWDVLN